MAAQTQDQTNNDYNTAYIDKTAKRIRTQQKTAQKRDISVSLLYAIRNHNTTTTRKIQEVLTGIKQTGKPMFRQQAITQTQQKSLTPLFPSTTSPAYQVPPNHTNNTHLHWQNTSRTHEPSWTPSHQLNRTQKEVTQNNIGTNAWVLYQTCLKACR